MLSDRGAAARLAVADLPPLDGINHVHLSSYVLGAGSRAAGLAALAAARGAAGASWSTATASGWCTRPPWTSSTPRVRATPSTRACSPRG
jgi:hypothetical protein